jgi:hypothetical protein
MLSCAYWRIDADTGRMLSKRRVAASTPSRAAATSATSRVQAPGTAHRYTVGIQIGVTRQAVDFLPRVSEPELTVDQERHEHEVQRIGLFGHLHRVLEDVHREVADLGAAVKEAEVLLLADAGHPQVRVRLPDGLMRLLDVVRGELEPLHLESSHRTDCFVGDIQRHVYLSCTISPRRDTCVPGSLQTTDQYPVKRVSGRWETDELG